MIKQQLSIIDMLSVICFCLTVDTINDTQLLEEHLEKQDQKIDKIIEVLKHDSR